MRTILRWLAVCLGAAQLVFLAHSQIDSSASTQSGTLLDSANTLPSAIGALTSGIWQSAIKDWHSTVRTQIQPVVQDVLGASVQRIKQLDPNAVVGFRGSLARGYKGPHRGNDPFEPSNFDVDGFVVSDKLAAQIPIIRGARFATRRTSPGLATEQQLIDQELWSKLSGLKARPFSFRVFTYDEYLTKANDGKFVGGN